MMANCLAHWALYFNQFHFQFEYQKTADRQNAEHLPFGKDEFLDEEESAGDVDIVCAISTLTFLMETLGPAALQKECRIPQVIRFARKGWPQKNNNVDVENYQKLADSLSTLH